MLKDLLKHWLGMVRCTNGRSNLAQTIAFKPLGNDLIFVLLAIALSYGCVVYIAGDLAEPRRQYERLYRTCSQRRHAFPCSSNQVDSLAML